MKNIVFVILALVVFNTSAQNAAEYYNKGNAQFQYQNYEEAIRLLTRAIAIKPDYADAYIMRGDANYFLKQFDKAILDYMEDDKYKKGRSGYNMACAYAQLGKKDEAFKALESHLASEHKLRWNIVTSDPDLELLRSDARWETLAKKSWYTPFETAVNNGDAKMSANDGAMITRKPNSPSAHGACSRDDPQPKFLSATRIDAP